MYDNTNSIHTIYTDIYNYKEIKKEIIDKKYKMTKENLLSSDEKKEKKRKTKEELIQSGKYDIYVGQLYANYSKYCAEQYGTEINKKYEMYLGVDLNLTPFEEKCCRQIYDSHRQKVERLKKKLEYNVNNYDCLWLTLTFKDDVLKSTSEKTRRTYIQRFLKDLGVKFYVANIDFGDKEKNCNSNEREHYHAIIRKDYLDMKQYEYGYIYVEKIRNSTNSISKISKYINKLTYHAYKDSTHNSRLIYSRQSMVV